MNAHGLEKYSICLETDHFRSFRASYPVKDITEIGFDGSVIGTIDEDKLTAVQRLALDAKYSN